MAGIELTHLSKRFGEVDVIHDLTLAIRDGEFLVLVGHPPLRAGSGPGGLTCWRILATPEHRVVLPIRSGIAGRRAQLCFHVRCLTLARAVAGA